MDKRQAKQEARAQRKKQRAEYVDRVFQKFLEYQSEPRSSTAIARKRLSSELGVTIAGLIWILKEHPQYEELQQLRFPHHIYHDDRVGHVYGNWKVLEYLGYRVGYRNRDELGDYTFDYAWAQSSHKHFRIQCICGKTTTATLYNLSSGKMNNKLCRSCSAKNRWAREIEGSGRTRSSSYVKSRNKPKPSRPKQQAGNLFDYLLSGGCNDLEEGFSSR